MFDLFNIRRKHAEQAELSRRARANAQQRHQLREELYARKSAASADKVAEAKAKLVIAFDDCSAPAAEAANAVKELVAAMIAESK